MKTYIAFGMLDWLVCLTVGKAKVRIHFEEGHITANGIHHARFSTAEKGLQTIIENSVEYKQGRIRLQQDPRYGLPARKR